MTQPDGTITSSLQSDDEARQLVDAIDADEIRQRLDWENTISTLLCPEAKQDLAETLRNGRYVVFTGRIGNDGRMHWGFHQPEHSGNRMVDTDVELSVFHLASLIIKSRRQASQTREIEINAVPDVVQQD